MRSVRPEHRDPGRAGADARREPAELMAAVARGDEAAFAQLYDLLADRVYGLVRRVVRDPAQSEEVTQEVFVELWRTASRYQADRGSVPSWALTIAHRRAVDLVRAAQASAARESRAASGAQERPFDAVADAVTERFERQQVRRCLESLTSVQRESVTLAYYQGYTYREVAALLETPIGTVKTRMRDGLIRLRDCVGVSR